MMTKRISYRISLALSFPLFTVDVQAHPNGHRRRYDMNVKFCNKIFGKVKFSSVHISWLLIQCQAIQKLCA